jgi:hypothetical protein
VIQLKAITSGYAVPRKDFETCVHSVFDEAVNLQPENANRLLTLLTAGCADLPQGVRIATPEGFSFEAHLQPVNRIKCRGGILADDQGRFEVDLSSAKRWKCSLPTLAADETTSQVVSAWTMVWQMLNQRQRETKTDLRAEALLHPSNHEGNAVSRKIGGLLRELVEAVRGFDISVETSLEGLIGLGNGLTPSGDDFLVGFLAGLRCYTDERDNHRNYLREFGKLVIRHSYRTNDISRTFLYHAAHGQVNSRLADLATAIAQGEITGHLQETAEKAIRVGHTSGMDTVTGLLVGMTSWGRGFLWIQV